MSQRSIGQSMVRWALENQFTEWFGRKAGRYSILRYEDFVKDPYHHLSGSLREVGLGEYPLSLFKSGELTLNPTHSIGGNPIRFVSKQISIVPDETWRKGLNPFTQAFIRLILFPWTKKYHYLGSQD